MSRVFLGVAICAAIAVAASPAAERGRAYDAQQPSDGRRSVSIDGELMAGALFRLARTYGTVVGYENGLGGPETKQLTAQLSNVYLLDAVESVVKMDPRFAWRLNPNGTITVFTKDVRPTLSDVRISHFEAKDHFRKEVSASLAEVPEVRKWLSQNRCTRTEWITGNSWRDDNKKITLNLTAKTFREVLDEVAKQSETYVWSIVQWDSGNGCEISFKL